MLPSAAFRDQPSVRGPGHLRQISNAFARHGLGGVATLLRYYVVRAATLAVGPGRHCPSCDWSGREFRPMVLFEDRAVRANAVCPSCGAWERQRAAVPVVRRLVPALFGDRALDILHFAPEECLARVLETHARRYRRSQYEDPAPGELRLDLHDLALPDGEVDLAVMSYVLSCVRDDRAAARSLWRVVRPGGIVLAVEPFTSDGRHLEWGRQGYGGQWRTFGTDDVASRFRPFETEVVDLLAGLDPSERRRRGLMAREYLLLLRRTESRAEAGAESLAGSAGIGTS